MKLFVIIGLLCLLVGCRPPKGEVSGAAPKASDTLVAIDSLMWSRPDSAFALLQEHFDPEQPYAQLLLAELLYKNDYAQTNRTELLRAVAHYDSLCDAFLDARAHYINGVGYYENDSVVEACQEYLKALEVMEEHFKEKELVGHRAQFMALTYNRLGGLFSSQFMPEPAITCYEEALAFCIKKPTSPNGVSNNYYRIGLHHEVLGHNDTAMYYYEKALEHLFDTNGLIYRNISTSKALLYYQINNDANMALQLLKNMERQSTDDSERLTRYLGIGSIYYNEGLGDSAKLYLEPVLTNSTDELSRICAAEQLRYVYDSVKELEKTKNCIRFLADHKKPESDGKALTSKLENIFKSFSFQKKERLAEKAHAQSIRKSFFTLFPLALLFVFIIAILINRISQTKRTKLNNEEFYALSKEPICQLIMGRVKEGGFMSQMDCTIYKDYALDKKQISDLRAAIDRHFNQFTLRISKAYPELTRSDLDYCCLYLLGLTDADIAALMQRAYNTINERNSKLKKVFNTKNALSPTLLAIANKTIKI